MELSQNINSVSENLEEKGRQLYQTNEHFRLIANVMEHPEFRQFFNNYMQDWDNVKMIIMFMKMYESIEKHSKVQLSPYQKISIIKEVIDDSQTRQKICQGLQNWIQSQSLKEEEKLSLNI